jgi:hypothetical protein
VLDRRLAGVGRFLGRHSHRDVSHQREILLARFVEDREVRVSRDSPVDLDEVDADLFQGADDAAAFVGIARHHLEAIEALPIQDGAGAKDSRARDQPRRDPGTPLVDLGETSSQVADTRHAIGEKDRQSALLRPAQVHVHVPEAGNEEPAAAVDDCRPFRDRRATGFDAGDPPISDHDRPIRLGRSPQGVDDGDVGDRQGRGTRGSLPRGGRGSRCHNGQQESRESRQSRRNREARARRTHRQAETAREGSRLRYFVVT